MIKGMFENYVKKTKPPGLFLFINEPYKPKQTSWAKDYDSKVYHSRELAFSKSVQFLKSLDIVMEVVSFERREFLIQKTITFWPTTHSWMLGNLRGKGLVSLEKLIKGKKIVWTV